MDPTSKIIHQLLIHEVKRRIIEESIPRIKKCLQELTLQETWYRPNINTVSVGNLILHLCGNVNQWIISGLGGEPDNRERDNEFNEMGPIAKQKLEIDLDILAEKLNNVLDNLTAEDLITQKRVQGYHETGISILIHATEHFSYHTGQITYYVKSKKDVDMKYYDGQNLNQK